MTSLKLVAIATIASGILAGATLTAQARPDVPQPSTCKPWVHSNMKKAKSVSKAKQRARGSWETQARRAFGLAWNDWSDAAYRKYGCTKKGKWHHCRAAAYPCKKPHW